MKHSQADAKFQRWLTYYTAELTLHGTPTISMLWYWHAKFLEIDAYDSSTV